MLAKNGDGSMDESGRRKRRAGGGRKRNDPPTRAHHVTMTDAQATLLRKWGRGDLSAGLRWLVDAAELLVRRADGGLPK